MYAFDLTRVLPKSSIALIEVHLVSDYMTNAPEVANLRVNAILTSFAALSTIRLPLGLMCTTIRSNLADDLLTSALDLVNKRQFANF